MTKYIKKLRPKPDYVQKFREYSLKLQTYGRFYGNYAEITGKRNRFSFQVQLNQSQSSSEKYAIITSICAALLQKKVPVHRPGQVFTYSELIHKTQWIPVRSLLDYKVGMTYEF